MAKKKVKKYNSFTFYTEHSMMRVVFLSMAAGCIGVLFGMAVFAGVIFK